MLPAEDLQGAEDAMKFRSCLTHIAEVATGEPCLRPALDRFYGGTPDPATLELRPDTALRRETVQALLQSIRAAARAEAPLAQERLSYGMPTLFEHGVLLHFGAFKQHIGLFPPVTEPVLREKAARYAGPKGNLQLPLNEPMPLALISEIVRTRLQVNRARRGTPQGGG